MVNVERVVISSSSDRNGTEIFKDAVREAQLNFLSVAVDDMHVDGAKSKAGSGTPDLNQSSKRTF